MTLHPAKRPDTFGRKKPDIWTNFSHATYNSGVHTPLLLEGNKALRLGLANQWQRLLWTQIQTVCPEWGGYLLQHLFCCTCWFLTAQVKGIPDGNQIHAWLSVGKKPLPAFEPVCVSIPTQRAVVRGQHLPHLSEDSAVLRLTNPSSPKTWVGKACGRFHVTSNWRTPLV